MNKSEALPKRLSVERLQEAEERDENLFLLRQHDLEAGAGLGPDPDEDEVEAPTADLAADVDNVGVAEHLGRLDERDATFAL